MKRRPGSREKRFVIAGPQAAIDRPLKRKPKVVELYVTDNSTNNLWYIVSTNT
jgi:hypothetical protein